MDLVDETPQPPPALEREEVVGCNMAFRLDSMVTMIDWLAVLLLM